MTSITQPSKTIPDNLLDYQELVARLNDSVRHLRRLVHEGRIPYVKVGHFIRFDPDEISQWLDDNRHGR